MANDAPAAAELAPDDPYAREAQTFPRLEPEMVDRLRQYGKEGRLEPGQLVFRRGDRSVDFFVVLSGAIEVFEPGPPSDEHPVHVDGPRQFTGELDLFNDRQILVSGRAGPGTTVIRISRTEFRRMIAAETDIGEIVMRAFILRRVGLIRHAEG